MLFYPFPHSELPSLPDKYILFGGTHQLAGMPILPLSTCFASRLHVYWDSHDHAMSTWVFGGDSEGVKQPP